MRAPAIREATDRGQRDRALLIDVEPGVNVFICGDTPGRHVVAVR